MNNNIRMLSVDWDAFFPVPTDGPRWTLFDWATAEGRAPTLNNVLWAARAAQFLANDLPLPGLDYGWDRFWTERVSLAPHAICYVADSHGEIGAVPALDGVTEVVNFDAHHDAYDDTETAAKRGVTCENWVTFYHIAGVKVRQVYPAWRADGLRYHPRPAVPVEASVDNGFYLGTFDRVFICRSSAWVGPWLDEAFFQFVAACPAQARISLEPVAARAWDPALAETIAGTIKRSTTELEYAARHFQAEPEVVRGLLAAAVGATFPLLSRSG